MNYDLTIRVKRECPSKYYGQCSRREMDGSCECECRGEGFVWITLPAAWIVDGPL